MHPAQAIEELLADAAEDGYEWVDTHFVAFWTGVPDSRAATILSTLEYCGRVESDGHGPRGRGVRRRWRKVFGGSVRPHDARRTGEHLTARDFDKANRRDLARDAEPLDGGTKPRWNPRATRLRIVAVKKWATCGCGAKLGPGAKAVSRDGKLVCLGCGKR